MTLGERIKQCRQDAAMSQEKLAELLGVSRQAVTKWGSGPCPFPGLPIPAHPLPTVRHLQRQSRNKFSAPP